MPLPLLNYEGTLIFEISCPWIYGRYRQLINKLHKIISSRGSFDALPLLYSEELYTNLNFFQGKPQHFDSATP